jgi:hypothetical protein
MILKNAKINNRPMGENSPNLVTLILDDFFTSTSGHPARQLSPSVSVQAWTNDKKDVPVCRHTFSP